MEHLWAPWRREYILNAKGKACIFCEALRAEPKEALVVGKGEKSFVMLNKYPYNNGHLLVAPVRHVADLEALEPEEATDLMESVRRAVGILKQVYHPDGLNLGMNVGRVAGAGVDEHLHFHVLPRWNGDTNFMSVCAETRVISEALGVTWETLSPFFRSAALHE
jgi:ATP adenylyltransferase